MIRADLTPATEAATYWTDLYSSYPNLVATILAAVFGTRGLTTNLTPSRAEAAPWQKHSVIVLLQMEGIAAAACCALIIWGFSRKAAT